MFMTPPAVLTLDDAALLTAGENSPGGSENGFSLYEIICAVIGRMDY